MAPRTGGGVLAPKDWFGKGALGIISAALSDQPVAWLGLASALLRHGLALAIAWQACLRPREGGAKCPRLFKSTVSLE